jgi:hypothetical protein
VKSSSRAVYILWQPSIRIWTRSSVAAAAKPGFGNASRGDVPLPYLGESKITALFGAS